MPFANKKGSYFSWFYFLMLSNYSYCLLGVEGSKFMSVFCFLKKMPFCKLKGFTLLLILFFLGRLIMLETS